MLLIMISVDCSAVRTTLDGPVGLLLRAMWGEGVHFVVNAADRRAVSGDAVPRLATNGVASAPARTLGRASAGAAADAPDGGAPVYQKPRTSAPHPEHVVYPYLLRDASMDLPLGVLTR